MNIKEILRMLSDAFFGILSLCWFAISWTFGYLWCKIVGHKFIETHYSKECDGSSEQYEICERCLKTKHTTIYDVLEN